MGKLKLELTPADLHTLSMSTQGGRGRIAHVPRDLLSRLLVDHTRLVNYVGKDNLEGYT